MKASYMSKGMVSLSAWILSALLLSSNLVHAENAQAGAPSKTSKIAQKPILFEIQAPALADQTPSKKPVKAYLFATIHVAKADFYPLPLVVRKAYKAADTVVVEADVSNTENSSEVVEKLSYTPPDKLENHLNPSTWQTLAQMTGAASAQFQRYTPVMVAMGLTISVAQQLGYEQNQGLDLHFIQQARKDKKNLIELEGVSFQTDVLAALSDAEGDAMLASTLETFRKGEVQAELARMVAAWKSGDLESLSKIMREAGQRDAGSQKLMRVLMDERNPIMVDKIMKMMREEKKLFVVLGAGHFAGEASILEILRQRGFSVKAVQ
ncbi:TraB/GumN family protein [Undibacterium cyanobacteriorum]|uniref:TraB/GumN family protein n=1 Tax=Undibacterium cyanobacteriorum TaxID=3073561 RepID=A0ABY9RH78_9BURK|nr:TraB/GumN family protein [Undibacterium sp. 20NA77.5]WMW80583.1 TraB/GumN family protein [Undibacterium sp. 20NA77.5]